MGQMIDISAKITNQLPVIKITDDIVVTVNNRHKTVLNVQAMIQETERKVTKGEEVKEDDFMADVMKILIGEKNTNAILEMNLPLPEHRLIYDTILNVATGSNGETPRK